MVMTHGSPIGCIIGKRGSRINPLHKSCNAQIVSRDYPGSEDQAVWITGRPDDIKKLTRQMASDLSRQNPAMDKWVVWTAYLGCRSQFLVSTSASVRGEERGRGWV